VSGFLQGEGGSLVAGGVARKNRLPRIAARAVGCVSFAALLVGLCCNDLQNAIAEGDTRTISLHHMHTGEDLTITYKVNGVYDEEALKKIDYELRDWRRDETIHMDPHLIDLVWEVHRDVGSTDPIQVVCGYRSPETNAMLRQRSNGVAKFSQHMLGKAIDFYLEGVPLEQIRAVGLYLQRGGVGFYPTSGSPFVHLDTGNVRHWPPIAPEEMPRLMAEGEKLHEVGETTAIASSRKQPAVLAQLGGHGTPDRDVTAHTTAPAPTVVAQVDKPRPVPQAKPKPQPATYEVASAESRPIELRPTQPAGPPGRSMVSANDMINQRSDYWRSLQPSEPANPPQAQTAQANSPQANSTQANPPQAIIDVPRPPAPIPTPAPIVVASADPQATASVPSNLASNVAPWPLPEHNNPQGAGALAYANPSTPAASAPARPAPMGTAIGHPTPPPDTTVALKRVGDRPSVVASSPTSSAASGAVASAAKSNDPPSDPWMRAMILSPSAQEFMGASSFGSPDYRGLAPYLHKPATSVMMTFSSDPQLGMTTRKFSGTAVVFVATVTYGVRTASLR
jgi:uncharacterized protein YcbK (DUF882 family)